MILGKKDVFKRLNEPETSSEESADDSDHKDEDKVEQYTAADIKYNLVNKNDTTKEIPKNLRPSKGYKYMGFTFFMMLVLMIVVIRDISSESYIDKRNQQHAHTTPTNNT